MNGGRHTVERWINTQRVRERREGTTHRGEGGRGSRGETMKPEVLRMIKMRYKQMRVHLTRLDGHAGHEDEAGVPQHPDTA